MTLSAVTHINFRGQARDALAFYEAVFGGRKTLLTYRDADSIRRPDEADQILWGEVATDDGLRLMAYDVPASMPWHPGENAYFVAVSGTNEAEIEARWRRLADGAVIVHPIAPAPWSPLYGMLKDRFGVVWVLSVVGAYALA